MLNESALEFAAAQARIIENESGFLPAVDDTRLKAGEVFLWLPIEGDGPLDHLVAKGRAGDAVMRAVVAATLYSLTRDNPSEGFEVLQSTLQRLATSVSVGTLVDPARARWELHLAASADSLERAVHVSRRLIDLDSTPEVRALAARMLFLLAHPSRPSLDVFEPSVFDPRIQRPGSLPAEVCDLFTYLLATIIEKRGSLNWTDPTALQTSTLDAVVDIEYLLKRVQSTTPLTPTQRAVQCWCGFIQAAAVQDLDKLSEAGRSYAALPAFPAVAGPAPTGTAAAAKCFAVAKNWSAATETAKRWTTEAPKDAQAMRRLAEAHYKQDEIPEALQAYEEYVRLREEGDNDWESSLLLHLGLEVQLHRNSAAALEAAAFSASIRPQAERLISWTHPWFDGLCQKARERWWVGMFVLTSPHVAEEIGAARWDQAADAFGEAVAFELKERVFRPFAESARIAPPDEHWKRALTGRGMLGQMIECLLQARQPNHPTAKQLSEWLAMNLPRLREHIRKTPPASLLKFARLRGQAQHESVDETDTRQVFHEAEDLLNAMAGK
jgi:tetratricopeptide (TPR) repeat protein